MTIRDLADNLIKCKRYYKYSLFPIKISNMEKSVMSQLLFETSNNYFEVIKESRIFKNDHVYDKQTHRELSIQQGIVVIYYLFANKNSELHIPEAGLEIFNSMVEKYYP